jgi:hypothetical protein
VNQTTHSAQSFRFAGRENAKLVTASDAKRKHEEARQPLLFLKLTKTSLD